MSLLVFKSNRARCICMISVASLVAFVLAFLLVKDLVIVNKEGGINEMLFLPKGNRTVVITSRKLMLGGDEGAGGEKTKKKNRIGIGCSKDDIVIYQGGMGALPSGIPAYSVEIMNICRSDDCKIGDIRVHCGWFSSARLISPKVFRRIGYDDCLVNDGNAMEGGTSISFQYANTFLYPLSVSSVVCFSS